MRIELEKFYGNERIVNSLIRSFENKDISHSYLFSGVKGIGKTTLAKSFAKVILEEDRFYQSNEGEDFQHPDLKVVATEENSIKKAQIEKILEEAAMTPFNGKYKVFIIKEFDKVTREGQNALLKTLEEPSKYVKLILTTSKERHIIPTILSRCRVLRFNPISEELIYKYLTETRQVQSKEAHIFARLSGGSIGQAIDYVNNNEYLSLRSKSLEILDNIIKSKGYYPLKVYPFFEENRDKIFFIFHNYLSWFRDLVLITEGAMEESIFNNDYISMLNSQKYIGSKRALAIIDKITERTKDIEQNINYQLAIETLLLYIQEENNG